MAFVISVGQRRVTRTSFCNRSIPCASQKFVLSITKNAFILSYGLINVLDYFTMFVTKYIHPSSCLIFCGFCYGKLRCFMCQLWQPVDNFLKLHKHSLSVIFLICVLRKSLTFIVIEKKQCVLRNGQAFQQACCFPTI